MLQLNRCRREKKNDDYESARPTDDLTIFSTIAVFNYPIPVCSLLSAFQHLIRHIREQLSLDQKFHERLLIYLYPLGKQNFKCKLLKAKKDKKLTLQFSDFAKK